MGWVWLLPLSKNMQGLVLGLALEKQMNEALLTQPTTRSAQSVREGEMVGLDHSRHTTRRH